MEECKTLQFTIIESNGDVSKIECVKFEGDALYVTSQGDNELLRRRWKMILALVNEHLEQNVTAEPIDSGIEISFPNN